MSVTSAARFGETSRYLGMAAGRYTITYKLCKHQGVGLFSQTYVWQMKLVLTFADIRNHCCKLMGDTTGNLSELKGDAEPRVEAVYMMMQNNITVAINRDPMRDIIFHLAVL